MSNWISCKDELPPSDALVDVWCENSTRHCNYKYVRDYGDKKGNNFFSVQNSGLTTIRVNDTYGSSATHWMYVPDGPCESDYGFPYIGQECVVVVCSGGPGVLDEAEYIGGGLWESEEHGKVGQGCDYHVISWESC